MDTAQNVVQVQEAGYKRLGKTRRDEKRMGESSGAFTTRGERETGEIGAGEHFSRTEDSHGDELTDRDVII